MYQGDSQQMLIYVDSMSLKLTNHDVFLPISSRVFPELEHASTTHQREVTGDRSSLRQDEGWLISYDVLLQPSLKISHRAHPTQTDEGLATSN